MKEQTDNNEEKVKSPSILQSFIIIILLLFSITIFNAAVRAILGSGGSTTIKIDKKPIQLLYDPDFMRNWTYLCPTENPETFYKITSTKCQNKTMSFWYIPWTRAWVWKVFDDNLTNLRRKRQHKKAVEIQMKEPKEAEEECGELEESSPPKEKEAASSSAVYTILTAMTLMSAIIALLEIFRDKFGKKPAEDTKELDRKCSLADFTIRRHQRKESQQESLQRQAAFDEPKKVKEMQQQSSLDRAISILTPAVRPMSQLPRQKSMPCRHSTLISQEERSLQSFHSASVDLLGEDGSPRRKSRHFIRRH